MTNRPYALRAVPGFYSNEPGIQLAAQTSHTASDEDLQFHLAKCVNLRVTRGQPNETDSIQDAWIGVSMPWGTLDEISEQEYEDLE